MPIFPGDLPNPEIKLGSPALKADSLLSEPPGKYPMFAIVHFYYMLSNALNWKRGQTKHVLRHFSCVRLFMTVWTVVFQAPLSMGFARQEYWRRLPFPAPGHLLNPGVESESLVLQADSLPLSNWGSPKSSIV